MVLVSLAAQTGCRRRQASGAPAAQPRPPAPAGLAAGHAGLGQALRAVVAECQLDQDGRVRVCTGQAEEELHRQERAAGPAEALRTYCRGLEEKEAALRLLCGARLARLSSPQLLRRAARPLRECLLAGVTRAEPRTRPALARAAALAASALGGEELLLKQLPAGRPELRSAALQALWANGRLRALPLLGRLLRSEPDPASRRALVRGFAESVPLEGAEQEQVCALLEALLLDADAELAAAAALAQVAACPQRGDRLLDGAERMAARSGLGPEYLTAIRAVNGFYSRRGSTEQRRRSAVLLGKLVLDRAAASELRGTALEHLSAIDPGAALLAARRLRGELPRSGPAASLPGDSALRDRVEALLKR